MAWNWLSPIPGTLYTQQYVPKQSGISLYVGIADDAPRSASLIVAVEEAAATRLDDWASTARAKAKASGSVGIFGILRQH